MTKKYLPSPSEEVDDRCLSALLCTLNRTARVNNQNEAVLWHYWAIPEKNQMGWRGLWNFQGVS